MLTFKEILVESVRGYGSVRRYYDKDDACWWVGWSRDGERTILATGMSDVTSRFVLDSINATLEDVDL